MTSLSIKKNVVLDLPNYTSMITLRGLVEKMEGRCDHLQLGTKVLPREGTIKEAGIEHDSLVRHTATPVKAGSDQQTSKNREEQARRPIRALVRPARSDDNYHEAKKPSTKAPSYEVLRVLDSRSYKDNRAACEFLVEYKGYKKAEWSDQDNLEGCTETLMSFHKEHPVKTLGKFCRAVELRMLLAEQQEELALRQQQRRTSGTNSSNPNDSLNSRRAESAVGVAPSQQTLAEERPV